MSWIEQIVDAVFPDKSGEKGNLPLPPSVMAAGGPWYKDLIPDKEEIMKRIIKDVLKKAPRLRTLNLYKIANEVMRDTNIYSYREYYRYLHNNFVQESIEIAQEQYEERHQKNMRWFYTISILKSKLRKVVKQFRKRQRLRYWEKQNIPREN